MNKESFNTCFWNMDAILGQYVKFKYILKENIEQDLRTSAGKEEWRIGYNEEQFQD